jgi:hypothetical protein
MEVNGIFEVVPDSLYSIQFAGEDDHEFSKIFRLWNDADYLRSFFETHYDDLLAFWEYMSVKEAVRITNMDAARLENEILNISSSVAFGGSENLSIIFKPLSPATWRVDKIEKSKARGLRKKSWLRVYAVRLGVNHFVVTGGAIKLTRTMNEREHLYEELAKLEEVCCFLRGDQKDDFGLFELF